MLGFFISKLIVFFFYQSKRIESVGVYGFAICNLFAIILKVLKELETFLYFQTTIFKELLPLSYTIIKNCKLPLIKPKNYLLNG